MQAWIHQIEGSKQGLEILRKNNLVYIAWEERTGKTLTSILICEEFEKAKTILIITKKKAIEGWENTLNSFCTNKKYIVTNYHAAKKVKIKPDLVILDEAHSYISGYPKRSSMWLEVFKLTKGLPVIFMSATPYAQGTSLLFNQLTLCSFSPWKIYKDFYEWFKVYADRDKNGEYKVVYRNAGLTAIDYTKTMTTKVVEDIKHLFMTKTRQDIGFEHEPEDKLHYIELSKPVIEAYNKIVKDKVLHFTHSETKKDYSLICDSPIKTRWSLHMLEGGTAKVNNDYLVLGNTEKVDYILKTWGDTKNLVIMYQYKADKLKLERYFKNALLLQSTSFAEGIDLSNYKHLVIYSQDFSTARHSQRRARQASVNRQEPITVHFLLVKKGISEKVYSTVSINKKNFVDTVFERI